jgi:hypothetical protein
MTGELSQKGYKSGRKSIAAALYLEVIMTGELSHKKYKNGRKGMAAATLPECDHDGGA